MYIYLHDEMKEEEAQNLKTKNVGSKCNDAPVCPRPRRLGSALPAQFLNQYHCSKHHQMNSDVRNGILNVTGEKRMDEPEICGCSSGGSGCSLSASPPGRTDNPLIRDVHFLQIHAHMEFFPPFTPT